MIAGYTWLNEAVLGKKSAVLRFGPGESDQLCARFDGEVGAPGEAFRIVFTDGNPPALDPLIEGERPVEVAFNTPGARVFFDALPLRRGRRWFKQWATLRWPEQINVVERRSGSREVIPDDIEMIAALSLPAGGAAALRARVWDLDLTGVACICPVHPDLPVPVVGEPCGILLSYGGGEYRLNGFCKNLQKLSSNSMRVGFKLGSETEFDPADLVRFRQLLEDLQSLRIRRGFRHELRTTVTYSND